ncbi:hypothetical protein [Paenibacillus ginsengihumi]|mgnify:CR=1 FL=1|uniref:hypothetical protein n=1 Tax=Paenibacillus ginsengihumi TaxID=431596 RepID=UPI00038157A6|nr:hypothetical protein [Paenibacillus ginsengihumi]
MYAYYALNEYHLMPWEFAELPRRRKAALIGMIRARIDAEKQHKRQMASARGSKRGRRGK